MQTIEGAKKTAATNKAKYGADYYAKIGVLGGKKKNPNKGFGSNKELARKAGAKGGAISKRGKSIEYELHFEDIHTKAETKKRVYSPSNPGVDSDSVPSITGKLHRAFDRVVGK
jgi:hypothetical protein